MNTTTTTTNRLASRSILAALLCMAAWSGTAPVAHGQADIPVIIQAESGDVGSEFDVLEEEGVTFVRVLTDWWTQDTQEWTRPVSTEHMITFEVTFPAAGEYNLFVRLRVNSDLDGHAGPDNDSFFFANGFGHKSPTDPGDWTFANQLDGTAGFTDPDDVVHEHGVAGPDVWKWLNISQNTYHNQGFTYFVPEGELTQIFQIAGREDGLDIDRLAFGRADLYFTVANLDNEEAGSTELPDDTDPIFIYEGPPLAVGHSKYLGNIYSPAQVSTTGPLFESFWNQVTPENAGKWGSVQPGSNPDPANWSWGALDAAYNLAKNNGWPFRFHVLVWGSQQPGWIGGLSEEAQLEAVRNWFQAVADRYEDIDRLEVVNEPIPAPPPYREALGGAGETGWDWVITAFEMAREIFPETTKLMINDYGILSGGSKLNTYLGIIELLQERGLIDAIGVQGHHFTLQNITPTTLNGSLNALGATGLPVVVTEFDLAGRTEGDADVNDPNFPQEVSDAVQLEAYQRAFPVIWEHPVVEGVTFWGWKLGGWRPGRQMHLVRADGSERPALTWLREYMADLLETSAEAEEHPFAFELHGNYPNPFNPSTRIAYELHEAALVTLDVFDLLGRHVKTLVAATQPPGHYTVSFDAGHLPSGVYLYRLQAGRSVDSRRMVFVK